MTLSEQLKAARESRGWTIEEVGAQLRLPSRVIARVERGEFEGLGAAIYRRGYLRSFARLVGVPESEVESSLKALESAEPDLVATGVMPRGEYVTERYLRPATYIALTALIALPVVWWAASGRLGQELAGRGSFDLQPPPLNPSSVATSGIQPPRPSPLPLEVPSSRTEMVRASMMPVPPTDTPTAPAQTGDDAQRPDASALPADAANVIGAGSNEAVLELTGDSWVEVTDAAGRRLQQALLAPGQWRYRSEGALSFKIGNSSNARLTASGRPIDLAAARSSNDVARVAVFGNDG